MVPPSGKETRSGKRCVSLKAANGINIKTFGSRTIHLHINNHRYKWKFTIADVSQPLLGTDFLRAHGLLTDMKGRRLIDYKTFASMTLHCAHLPAPQLGSVTASDNNYAGILAAFPDIVQPHFHSACPSMVYCTTFPLQDRHYTHVQADFHQISSHKQKKNFARWKKWELYVDQTVHGRPHYTWFGNHLGPGDLVGITASLTTPQLQTLSLTSRILRQISTEAPRYLKK